MSIIPGILPVMKYVIIIMDAHSYLQSFFVVALLIEVSKNGDVNLEKTIGEIQIATALSLFLTEVFGFVRKIKNQGGVYIELLFVKCFDVGSGVGLKQ